jgi:hypothetical protein
MEQSPSASQEMSPFHGTQVSSSNISLISCPVKRCSKISFQQSHLCSYCSLQPSEPKDNVLRIVNGKEQKMCIRYKKSIGKPTFHLSFHLWRFRVERMMRYSQWSCDCSNLTAGHKVQSFCDINLEVALCWAQQKRVLYSLTVSAHSSWSRFQTVRPSTRPLLWSSGQSSWLQIQRSALDSRCYQISWEVAGLGRVRLSLASINEELFGRKSIGSRLENRDYGRRDPSRWPCDTPLSAKFGTNFSDMRFARGIWPLKTFWCIILRRFPIIVLEANLHLHLARLSRK